VVNGWDDPRLFTVDGIRRRGIPIEAMNEFLDLVPVSRKGNDNYIQLALFDHAVKGVLDKICPRTLAVTEPVGLEITDLKDDETLTFEAPNFPNDLS
jgi:glutaminyl-tRNA synthetase